MAGSSLFLNPLLTTPVFVIPPEWYAGLMALSNSWQRAVRIMRKVSSRSFLSCYFFLFGFMVSVGDVDDRYNKIITYVVRIHPFGCRIQHIYLLRHHVDGAPFICMVVVFHLAQAF